MLEKILDKINIQTLVTDFVRGALAFLPNIVIAILIIIAAYVLSRGVRVVFRKALKSANFSDVIVRLLVDNVLHYAIIILGLLMALSELGVNVTAALAGVGVAGIAIGFAAQDSVANVISGILIFWDKPFVVGDWVTAEGEYGKVTDITLRTTRIRTPKNTYIVIPNKRIIDGVLENFSKHGEVRVDVSVGIAYGEDIDAARKVLLNAVSGVEGLRSEPGPEVIVEQLGGSSVDLKLRVWIDKPDALKRTGFQLTELAKTALDEAGIQIPFPHLQLILDTVEQRVWDGARDTAKAIR